MCQKPSDKLPEVKKEHVHSCIAASSGAGFEHTESLDPLPHLHGPTFWLQSPAFLSADFILGQVLPCEAPVTSGSSRFTWSLPLTISG